MGYPIVGIEEEDTETEGYYLEEREFEDAELRMLIDSVLFSKTIAGSSAKKLIEKLKLILKNGAALGKIQGAR